MSEHDWEQKQHDVADQAAEDDEDEIEGQGQKFGLAAEAPAEPGPSEDAASEA